MDKIIELKVSGSHLTRDSQTAGVQHEGNAAVLRMTFDPGWDGFAKTVTFWNAKGEAPVKRILTTELLEDIAADTRLYLCPIPSEAMTEAGWLTYVIDGMADGVRRRSVEDRLKVLTASYAPEAGESADPTPTQAEQLQVQVDGLLDTLQAGIASAEQAVASAAAAAESEQSARASALTAGGSEKNAVASEQAAADSAVEARSYAQGGTGTREGEDRNNARYYMEQAQKMAGGEFLTEEQLEQRLEQLTAADVGAAGSSHVHNAADITGGTLASARLPTVPVSKGGTGKTALTAGSYLVGSGTSTVGLKTPTQVLADIGAASAGTLTDHTGNRNNPHGITKAQVGLSSVPNVSTNNQTPTYTAATALAALVSGEKLSVAFGKLAKAVTELMAHLAGTSNPHGVTAAQAGAVALNGGNPMTGNLVVKKATPLVRLDDTAVGSSAMVAEANNQLLIQNIDVTGNDANRRQIILRNASHSSPDLTEALLLNTVIDNKQRAYRIYGEHNKPSAADVGAAALDGSNAMSGNLSVFKENPAVGLKHTANGCGTHLTTANHEARLQITNVYGDSTNRRYLQLFDSGGKSSVAEAVYLVDVVNGTAKGYAVLHTGNVVASAADITAGSSAGWQQYLVYA